MFQSLLFAMYAYNSGLVDGTDMFQSVVYIVREFTFTTYLSPERLNKGTSEGQHALDQFEAASTLLFIQRELFNILVS